MKSLELYLDGTSPDKLSMRRLADYLRWMAEMYGEESAVHFDKVEVGSARLHMKVEDDSYGQVVNRSLEAVRGLAPRKANEAYLKLVSAMEEDHVDGILRNHEGAQIIQFPRVRDVPPPLVIFKHTFVQGRIYMVGGKDETVPVRLQGPEGETLTCEATVALAEKLGSLMFKNVRLSGQGEWVRHVGRGWQLKKLKIESFEVLERVSLRAAIDRLSTVGGNLWDDMHNPHSDILSARS